MAWKPKLDNWDKPIESLPKRTQALGDIHHFDTASSTWTDLTNQVQGDVPGPRFAHGFTSTEDDLYVFGGATDWSMDAPKSAQGLSDLLRFNPSTLTWTNLTAESRGKSPSARALFGFAAIGKILYVFGGREGSDATVLNDLHCFDTTSLEWRAVIAQGPLPAPRMGHSLAAVGGQLYLYGGYLAGLSTISAELFVLDQTTFAPAVEWQNLSLSCNGSVPSARALHATAVLNSNKLLICMGRPIDSANGISGTHEIYSLDIGTLSWTLESSKINSDQPKLRYGGGAAVVNDRIFLFGGAWNTGYATAGIMGTLEVLDLRYYMVTDMLKVRGEVPWPRMGHGMAAARGDLYIFSGFNDYKDGEFVIYRPAICTYTSIGTQATIKSNSPPHSRVLFSFVGGGDVLYLFGGLRIVWGIYPVRYLNDLWLFNTTTYEWSSLEAQSPPSPRHGHGLAVLGSNLFVFGGSAMLGPIADFTGDPAFQPVPVNDLHIFDLQNNTWSKLEPSPETPAPRVEFGFVAVDQLLYLFGGAYQYYGVFGAFYADFYSFDPRTKIWTNLTNDLIGPSIPARCGHGFVASSGSLFVFDGSGQVGTYGGGLLSDLYRIDVKTFVVTEISSLVRGTSPSARMRFGSALNNGIIYIYGGQDESGYLWDLQGFAVEKTVSLSSYSPVSFFMKIYDWDMVKVESGITILPQHLDLCSGSLPCSMKIRGSAGNILHFVQQGSISCRSIIGCTALILESIHVTCASPGMFSTFDIQGSRLHVSNSTFDSCSSNVDGGTIKTYHSAVVAIVDSVFRNSWSNAQGGAVSLVGVLASLVRVTFINCSSLKGGGALAMSGFTLYGSSQPFNTNAEISYCNFQRCSSGENGGAVFASTSAASVSITRCIFEVCMSSKMGGAIAATNLVDIDVSHSVFDKNNAEGHGGGALYFGNAPSLLQNITFHSNSAKFGGGGAILWSGEYVPQFQHPEKTSKNGVSDPALAPDLLCLEDSAAYGPCIASTYKSLEVRISLRENEVVYPGLYFPLEVLKKDYYNQTIVTDSASVIQLFADSSKSSETDPSVSILGSTVALFSGGQALFSIAIKPKFLNAIPCNDSSLLNSPPAVYVEGTDSLTKLSMRSDDFVTPLSGCNNICPKGHVLQLDQVKANAKYGICTFCSTGTYSLNPLTGSLKTPDTPSCLKCPAGAECNAGGDQVSFMFGEWSNIDGRYILNSCPVGHQLINSTIGTSFGVFSHDDQQCRQCKPNQYIVDELQPCQTCPTGATCDGTTGQLTGLSGSHWRREGDKLRAHGCDPGYILVRDDSQDGAKSFLDACVKCLPSTYSLLGAQVIDLEPCAWSGELGSFSCKALTASNVVAFTDDKVRGAWTPDPSSAQQLCIKCPVGASCPGGSDVIPQQGFWMDNYNANENRLSARSMTQAGQVSIMKCPPDACGENGTCNKGRRGPVCAVCEDGWAMSSNDCQECPTDRKGYDASRILAAIGGSLGMIVLYYYFSLRPLFAKDQTTPGNETAEDQLENDKDIGESTINIEAQGLIQVRGMLGIIKARLIELSRDSEVLLFLQGYFKVIISFFQVLSTFSSNLRIAWPPILLDLFQKSLFLRMDLLALPGLNCLTREVDYQSKLIVYTVFPLVIISLLCIPVCISRCFSGQRSKSEAVESQFWYALMFFLFFTYPTLSLATLQSFNCKNFGRYGSLLLTDYNEPCPYQEGNIFSSHSFIFWWSLTFTLFYPIGIPIFFLFVMTRFKIPDLANSKIKRAKIEALINCYRGRAMPLEVEILTRQLKVGNISLYGDLLEMRTQLLFDAVALGKSEITKTDLVNFIKNPELGLPDPDEIVIQELFEARDTSKDGKLDKEEFSAMMLLAIHTHDLFTGHEALEDMHFEQLCRLYEYHANNKIYIETRNESEEIDSQEKKSLSTMARRISDAKESMQSFLTRRVSGSKRKLTADMLLETKLDSAGREIKPVDSEYFTLDETEEIQYPGLDKLRELEKAVSRNVLCKVQEMMVPDLRRKLLALADTKLASGSIVLKSLAWDMTEQNTPDQITATDEQMAVKRLGFLMRNYDVQHWYFEILEMIRKLLITSIIAFIYPGTSAQIVAALLISTLSAVHVQYTRPFLDNKIGNTQTYALLAHSLTLVYGIMLLFEEIYSDMLHLPQSFSQQAVTQASATLVVLLNVGTVAMPYISMLIAFLVGCCLQWRAAKNDSGQDDSHLHLSTQPSAALLSRGRASHTPYSASMRDARLWSRSCLPEAPLKGHLSSTKRAAYGVGGPGAVIPQEETQADQTSKLDDEAGEGVGLTVFPWPATSDSAGAISPLSLSLVFQAQSEEPEPTQGKGPFCTEQLRKSSILSIFDHVEEESSSLQEPVVQNAAFNYSATSQDLHQPAKEKAICSHDLVWAP